MFAINFIRTHAPWRTTYIMCMWENQSLTVRYVEKYSNTVNISKDTKPRRVTRTQNSSNYVHSKHKRTRFEDSFHSKQYLYTVIFGKYTSWTDAIVRYVKERREQCLPPLCVYPDLCLFVSFLVCLFVCLFDKGDVKESSNIYLHCVSILTFVCLFVCLFDRGDVKKSWEQYLPPLCVYPDAHTLPSIGTLNARYRHNRQPA